MSSSAPAPSVPWNNDRRNPYGTDLSYLAAGHSVRSPSTMSKRSAVGPRAASASVRSDYSVNLDVDLGDDLDDGNDEDDGDDDDDDVADGAPPPPPVRRPGLASPASNTNLRSQRHSRVRESSSGSQSSREGSFVESLRGVYTEETAPTSASIHLLPPLQSKGPPAAFERLEPVVEDDPSSYDLVEPATNADKAAPAYSLEQRADDIFSREHLLAIFEDPALLLRFTSFLGSYRRSSVPVLIYYLDALKAIKAIKYANAVTNLLEPIQGLDFTKDSVESVHNEALQKRASEAFQVLLNQELPAFVTHVFTNVVSASIQQRITGRLPPHLREASEGLAEVFCLSDPSRKDNPIVFASEEFHRTTQYGMEYAIGRNCRFLQGPQTSPYSVARIGEAIKAGKDHSETFVNYRRDGSPFLNLLMVAPLRDSRGTLRYFIGAQVDVSGLAKECTGLEGLQKLLVDDAEGEDQGKADDTKDEFQGLAEMFNLTELDVVKQFGGRMHRQHAEQAEKTNSSWNQPRLLLQDDNLTPPAEQTFEPPSKTVHGRLVGVYSHYMLVRPSPSLRIIFTSPSMRVPGTLQSPFMDRIGSSERVREELANAFAAERGVTAKIRWRSGVNDDSGRSRWIHCTPLLGPNGKVGVWMVVIVDDSVGVPRTRFKDAPPVAQNIPKHRDLDGYRSVKKSTGAEKPPPTAAGLEEPYPDFGKPSIVSGKR